MVKSEQISVLGYVFIKGSCWPVVENIGIMTLNHSFMIPGLIGFGTSTVVTYLISWVIL